MLKHSHATKVSFTLVKVADGLSLLIQDIGVWIDFEKLRKFENQLKNMKRRMDEMCVDF